MIGVNIIEGPTFVHASDDADGWEHYFYVVRLTRGEKFLTTPWKQGTGIHEDPTAESVLASLLMDSSVQGMTFEEWASDYGYDIDSRRAERLYTQVVEQTNRLADFLGFDFDATTTEDAEDAAKRLVSA